jgi:hypothetical protein
VPEELDMLEMAEHRLERHVDFGKRLHKKAYNLMQFIAPASGIATVVGGWLTLPDTVSHGILGAFVLISAVLGMTFLLRSVAFAIRSLHLESQAFPPGPLHLLHEHRRLRELGLPSPACRARATLALTTSRAIAALHEHNASREKLLAIAYYNYLMFFALIILSVILTAVVALV